MFKIRMNQTVKLFGTWPMVTFHKGTTYTAYPATNQPNWRKRGLVFAEKRNGEGILLCPEDYTVVSDK